MTRIKSLARGRKMETDDYMAWEKQTLADIGSDTDALIKMIGEKTMGDSFDNGLLTGMMRNGDGINGGNGMWLLVLFLLILGRGNGLLGGSAEDIAKNSTLINETNYSRLMDAISTQGTRQEVAIGDLANAVGANFGEVKLALSGLDSKLCQCGSDIKSAIQSCCCNVRQEITASTAALGQSLQETRYLITAQGAAQDAMIAQKFADQNAYLASQFCEIKNREDARQIADLQQKLADAKSSANTNAILAAIAAKDTVSGTVNTTAGTWAGTIN